MRLVHFKKSRRHKSPSRSKSRSSAKSPRRYRRNPSAAGLKQILSPSNFMQIGSVTVGFVGGAKVGGMIYNKLFSGTGALAKFRRFAGLATFALGTFAAGKVKNDLAKKAAAGIAAAGIYDLIAQNVPQAGLKPVNGDSIDMNGVDLVGDGESSVYAGGGDTVDVSGDMTELVGSSDDSIYG